MRQEILGRYPGVEKAGFSPIPGVDTFDVAITEDSQSSRSTFLFKARSANGPAFDRLRANIARVIAVDHDALINIGMRFLPVDDDFDFYCTAERVLEPLAPDQQKSPPPSAARHEWTLASYLAANQRANRTLSKAITYEWLRRIFGAVAALHEKDMVHGFLTTSAIKLRRTGDEVKPYVSDVFCAQLSSDIRKQGFPSAPQFQADEFRTLQNAGKASDVFSLGMIAYELLLPPQTRTKLQSELKLDQFSSSKELNAFWRNLHKGRLEKPEMLPPLETQISGGHTPEFYAFIEKTIAPRPEQRFEDAGKAFKALTSIVGDGKVVVIDSGGGGGKIDPPSIEPKKEGEKDRWRRPSTVVAAVLGGLALFLLGWLAYAKLIDVADPKLVAEVAALSARLDEQRNAGATDPPITAYTEARSALEKAQSLLDEARNTAAGQPLELARQQVVATEKAVVDARSEITTLLAQGGTSRSKVKDEGGALVEGYDDAVKQLDGAQAAFGEKALGKARTLANGAIASFGKLGLKVAELKKQAEDSRNAADIAQSEAAKVRLSVRPDVAARYKEGVDLFGRNAWAPATQAFQDVARDVVAELKRQAEDSRSAADAAQSEAAKVRLIARPDIAARYKEGVDHFGRNAWASATQAFQDVVRDAVAELKKQAEESRSAADIAQSEAAKVRLNVSPDVAARYKEGVDLFGRNAWAPATQAFQDVARDVVAELKRQAEGSRSAADAAQSEAAKVRLIARPDVAARYKEGVDLFGRNAWALATQAFQDVARDVDAQVKEYERMRAELSAYRRKFAPLMRRAEMTGADETKAYERFLSDLDAGKGHEENRRLDQALAANSAADKELEASFEEVRKQEMPSRAKLEALSAAQAEAEKIIVPARREVVDARAKLDEAKKRIEEGAFGRAMVALANVEAAQDRFKRFQCKFGDGMALARLPAGKHGLGLWRRGETFQRNILAAVPELSESVVTIAADLCVNVQPVSIAEFREFARSVAPAEREKIRIWVPRDAWPRVETDSATDGTKPMTVTHEGAEAFAAWFAKKTGQSYRLMTPSEWLAMLANAEATNNDAVRDSMRSNPRDWTAKQCRSERTWLTLGEADPTDVRGGCMSADTVGTRAFTIRLVAGLE